jgi:hypothetical protein
MTAEIIDLSSERQKRAAREAAVEKASSQIDLLFHDPDGVAWANVIIAGHRETLAVESEELSHFIKRQAWEAGKELFGQGLLIPKAMLADRIERLKAQALYDGPQHPVFLRVGEHKDAIYVDMGDREWRAIRIGRFGWEMVKDPPVYFRRSAGMLPLPFPEPGGSIDELRPFCNIHKGDFVLVVAWLLAALRSRGPYPILVLTGVTGATKSTFGKFLLSLVDPNSIPLRPPPVDVADLNVAALHSHCLLFDNVSRLSQWLSDALCRLSTGGGTAQRQFYTRQKQVRFPHMARPMIVNGVAQFITQPDLQNRSIDLAMEYVANRKSEATLYAEFEAARPRIFAALLDLMVIGMRNLPDTNVPNPPRMAEFVHWAVACRLEGFEDRYRTNLLDSTIAILEGDELASAVKALMSNRKKPWLGNATELAKALKEFGYDPESSRALSARLRRLAEPLRTGFGIAADFSKRLNTRRLIKLTSSPSSLASRPGKVR